MRPVPAAPLEITTVFSASRPVIFASLSASSDAFTTIDHEGVAWALWLMAAFILVVHSFWGGTFFASPWLAWTGLSSSVRPSLDFLPLVPWFAFFVAGMALAKSLPLSRWDLPNGIGRRVHSLTWPGRHSLAIYLLHQPVLIGLLWVFFTLSR